MGFLAPPPMPRLNWSSAIIGRFSPLKHDGSKLFSFAPEDAGSAAALAGSILKLEDFSTIASSYFTSIRVPAALIAGSSLSALFSMIEEAKYLQEKETRPRYIIGLAVLLYHSFALISLLLSLNVVVTATSTSNSILLGCPNPLASSAFDLLTREFQFEFLTTRWSFFTSIFSFICSVTLRALIEFQLLRRDRIRQAALVVFSSGSLLFHLLAFVNSRLRCYPNLGSMTIGIFLLWIQNCYRRPCEVLSVACFAGSVLAGASVIRRQCRRLSFSRSRKQTLFNGDMTAKDAAHDDDMGNAAMLSETGTRDDDDDDDDITATHKKTS